MFFAKKKLPFLFDKASMEKAAVARGKTVDGSSESGDSFLDEEEIRNVRSRKYSQKRWWIGFFTIHLFILAFYAGTVINMQAELSKLRKHGLQLIQSPASGAMQWAEHTFVENSFSHGPFSGYPREEIDKNWHDLINYENIIIEPEIIRKLGREDIAVADPEGRGYLGTLNVYHQLHCIKRLWQYSYPEVYRQNQTPAEAEADRLHKEHCFDFLRQSVMCLADIGIITYQWTNDRMVPIANSTTHQCANWEKLDAWTKERSVDMMKPGWLIHPNKGYAYKDMDHHH
ncbi:hypothetical protein ISF_01088 [Cordyceps fumosorosea ARSEF 2679]|uniref:Tat pathway signal sequence n=1 Tax=Cordyceps fumosorosea (strain ARSEF 2679) TaxID=1081104 RepID=A0A168ET82_CORFA|nr:hypothetical protein ISF_01088 [Cordyceps fumosorosea ARSEF 2679]OAA74187.1 hypothetical protein ISF_01088 [Cordyceps fumosorosea ARSEF 2679]